MNGHSRGRRGTRLGVAFAAAAAIAMLALGASAQAATTGPDTLAGLTSQHFPVFFKVSGDGKTVTADGIALGMTCVSGGRLVWPDSFNHLPIHNGKIHVNFASPTILQNGTATTVNDVLTARLSPNHSGVTGTWHISVKFSFSDGTGDSCDSGPVAFSATS